MTTYFAPIARLLGDLVVSLPPLQQLIEDGKDVCLILRSPAQEGLCQRIPGLQQFMRETDFLQIPESQRHNLYNLRDHPLQREHVWGSPEFHKEYPGVGITELLSRICRDFGIRDGQEALKPLSAFPKEDCRGKIIFIPGTAAPIKRWPDEHWLELYQLLDKASLATVMIGEPRLNPQISALMKSGLPWAATPTLADALDAITFARAVVSVDTGLMHLAVHQGVKTLALFRENTMFLRKYPQFRYLIAPRCSADCRKREFDFSPHADLFFPDWNTDSTYAYWANLHCRQDEMQSCMYFVSPEQVLDELLLLI